VVSVKSSSKICLSKNSLKYSTGGCPVMSGTTPEVVEDVVVLVLEQRV
jgi:hypothetical protein